MMLCTPVGRSPTARPVRSSTGVGQRSLPSQMQHLVKVGATICSHCSPLSPDQLSNSFFHQASHSNHPQLMIFILKEHRWIRQAFTQPLLTPIACFYPSAILIE